MYIFLKLYSNNFHILIFRLENILQNISLIASTMIYECQKPIGILFLFFYFYKCLKLKFLKNVIKDIKNIKLYCIYYNVGIYYCI